MDNETKNFLTNVANRIEQVRELRGLSRQEVATAAGLTYAGMHAIETRAQGTQIDTLFRVAKALGVTPGLLLDGGTITREAEVTV
jgi:transcriptional regulator with XRE-family HTH domain